LGADVGVLEEWSWADGASKSLAQSALLNKVVVSRRGVAVQGSLPREMA
jgi:hypothetical protein